ncbi:MAG: CocE/NonD family hydrolase, partial [Gemmatimonadetes bacterium]|nr:CocE/NonD family hydrolase [Gemmatimonadota bacterium]
AARQPWSTGQVATRGVSYLAYDQWQLAAAGCEALVTMMPSFSPMSLYRDVHPGGAFEITRIVWAVMMNGRTRQMFPQDWATALRHLPVLTIDESLGQRSMWWRDLVTHPSFDGYWEPLDMKPQLEHLDLPVQGVGGWFDTFLRSTLDAYSGMAREGTAHGRDQRMIIGPWYHGGNGVREPGELDFGPDAVVRLDTLELAWADRWLRGTERGDVGAAPIRLFVMGANVWRDVWEWPPSGARPTPYYLHSGGSANGASGDGVLDLDPPGTEPVDSFTYDPNNPVPTLGGSLPGANPDMRSGVFDQRRIEERPDVLVYTTAPLSEDLEVIGPVEVVLYAATDARDTDFTAKLVDVHPDGRAMNLTDGIVRARYRESTRAPKLLTPGEVVEYRIDLVATANVFRAGHRVRVEISSSNFPRFSRNLNTGGEFATETSPIAARQRVFHDTDRASYVLLPVVR